MVIYGDILFLLNTAINYLLLIITAKICDSRVSRLRCFASAALGGTYALVSLAFPTLSLWPVIIAVGGAMTFTAFYKSGLFLRKTVVFFAVSAAFAGAVYGGTMMTNTSPFGYARPITLHVLVFAFGISYGVISLVFRRAAKNVDYRDVEIVFQNRRVCFRAMVDTGNSLRDPITGEKAVVVDFSTVRTLFDSDVHTALSALTPYNTTEVFQSLPDNARRAFRLIPFGTVGERGLMLCFTAEVTAGGHRNKRGIVAIAPQKVADSAVYSALI